MYIVLFFLFEIFIVQTCRNVCIHIYKQIWENVWIESHMTQVDAFCRLFRLSYVAPNLKILIRSKYTNAGGSVDQVLLVNYLHRVSVGPNYSANWDRIIKCVTLQLSKSKLEFQRARFHTTAIFIILILVYSIGKKAQSVIFFMLRFTLFHNNQLRFLYFEKQNPKDWKYIVCHTRNIVFIWSLPSKYHKRKKMKRLYH